jgi:mono/diheme cytochrome c family protein
VRTLAAAAVVVLVAVGGGGCGGKGRAAAVRRGHAVFVAACAGCHSLTGRERGAVGGDLAVAQLDVDDLAGFARVMPARIPLSQADAVAVARYVHSVASSLRRRGRRP